MSGVHCFTSFTYTYLSRARVLAQSLRSVHPDWTFWALIVDELPAGVSAAEAHAGFDRVVFARDLGIPSFDNWIFRHDVVEACTAVKGRMLVEMLKLGCETVVYLDPDVAVFSPLTRTLERLDGASILLTPHQTDPNNTMAVIADNELGALKHGTYNLGFIAVRNGTEGHRFANWWADMLHLACYDDPANGLFTDQKWCDLVPAFFDGVRIERDPGCNVASWNLSRRQIEIGRDGSILVNGSPLKFYHFTKVNSVGDAMTERYAAGNIHVHEIWHWYKRAIAAQELTAIPRDWWAYGRFDNGVPVSKPMRRLLRDDLGLATAFPKPLQTAGGSYFDWLSREKPEIAKSGSDGFVVLGMHRSGTSALAGWFGARGICHGDRFIEADTNNPDGYWEHEELVAINEHLLSATGTDWRTIDAVSAEHVQKVGGALSDRAQAFLLALGRDRRLWFMKDPRLCRTLPFWLPLLDALSARIHYLHIVRDPWSVARSLTRRDGLPTAHSHLLWALSNLEAELHTRNRPRLWLDFDAMVAGGDTAVLSAISDHLPEDDRAGLAGGLHQDTISPDRVHAAGPRGDDDQEELFDVGRVYGLLAALRDDDGRPTLLEEIDAARNQIVHQVRTYRTLLLDRERDDLREQVDTLAVQSLERFELWRRTDEQLRAITEQRDRVLQLLQERLSKPLGPK
ncbi:sulfotransferase family protein [Azospirillum largimobile]